MFVFQIPIGICKKMTDAIAQFWWGDDENSKRMHWLAWWKLCCPKDEGVMGFRDFHSFNLAMLAKQGWRLITAPDSLCAKVLKARYFPNTSILEATVSPGISYSWRSILRGLELLKDGIIWRIGDGENIRIWDDPWLNREGSRQPITPRRQCLLTRVHELINPITGEWDELLIRDTFWEMDAKVILTMPIRPEFEDFPAWYYDKKGLFSVRSAYKIYVKQRDKENETGRVLQMKARFGRSFGICHVCPK